MTLGTENTSRALEQLSALADGELDADASAHSCAHWRDDANARASWHAYHLIGDVLRSDELASDAQRDAGFLRTLRQRLAQEPVVMAPQADLRAITPAPSTEARSVAKGGRSSRWAWLAPMTVAAGFVAVAGALLVTQVPTPAGSSADGLLAQASRSVNVLATAVPVLPAASSSGAETTTDPQTLVADGQVMRDARLDRYLTAHKQFGGSSALGVPSGFLRSATAQAPGR